MTVICWYIFYFYFSLHFFFFEVNELYIFGILVMYIFILLIFGFLMLQRKMMNIKHMVHPIIQFIKENKMLTINNYFKLLF